MWSAGVSVAIGASMLVFAAAASASVAPGALSCSLPKYNPTHYGLEAFHTTTCTIEGASDASGLKTVPVTIKSSNFGNTTVTGTVSSSGSTTKITFTFTAPSAGCNTSIVSYISNGNNSNNSLITSGGTSSAGFAFVDSSGTVLKCGGTVPPTPRIFLGYADNYFTHGDPLGLPWIPLSPSTIFVGCGGYPSGGVPAPAPGCEKVPGTTVDSYDAGAIRIVNSSTTLSMSVTGGSVNVGDCTYTPWGSTMNISIPPGGSLVLTQTGGPKPCDTDEVGPYNFDTSEASGDCRINNGLIPVLLLTINGSPVTIDDTGQILNTGGRDVGLCGGDEFHAFTQVSP